jgi:hypothetical protein
MVMTRRNELPRFLQEGSVPWEDLRDGIRLGHPQAYGILDQRLRENGYLYADRLESINRTRRSEFGMRPLSADQYNAYLADAKKLDAEAEEAELRETYPSLPGGSDAASD